MESQLYALSKPATAKASDHADFVVLSFEADGSTASVYLPKRMQACVGMIVEAFNAHMKDGEPKLEPYVEMTDGTVLHGIKAAEAMSSPQVPFPTGASTSLALAVATAADLDLVVSSPHGWSFHRADGERHPMRFEVDGDWAGDGEVGLYDWDDADDAAAHVVERRDLP